MHLVEDRSLDDLRLLRPSLSDRAARSIQRLKEEQIIAVLKEAEAGAKPPDLCRRYGVSLRAFYRWKVRFRGLLRQLRELEDENSTLKRLVGDLFLEKQTLTDLIKKEREDRSALGLVARPGRRAARGLAIGN